MSDALDDVHQVPSWGDADRAFQSEHRAVDDAGRLADHELVIHPDAEPVAGLGLPADLPWEPVDALVQQAQCKQGVDRFAEL